MMNAAPANPANTEPSDVDRGWLVCAGRVLASAEVALSRRRRRTGLIGRRNFEGALVIPRCNWVHTIGVRFPIDAAFLDENDVVLKVVSMGRMQIGAPVSHATTVLEATRGSFDRWNLHVGDCIEIRGVDIHGSTR